MNPSELAFSFANHTSQHIFLTGKAGTGKTTFLKKIIGTTPKNTVVVAPTGVAAINAGGVTIHSFFQLPFGTFIPDEYGYHANQAHTKGSILRSLRINTTKRKLMKELELLIIDEVSMVRADMLDAINVILQHVRQNDEPFGGVQVLMIGDLFQLPPVVTERDKAIIEEYYATPYFFSAKVMEEAPLRCIELTTIYRQTDEQFIGLLNNIRENEVTEQELQWLNDKCNPEFDPSETEGVITLTTHNKKAEHINAAQLSQLGRQAMTYRASISGDFPQNSYPVAVDLVLKEGAQVIFMRNDTQETKRYYNGKIGVISGISSDVIHVRFPEEDVEIEVEKEVWKNVTYKLNETTNLIEEVELGNFTQYPLKLAWAITIHKSQGLTFEKAVVDAGASFSPGQVYVALSRLRSAEGLILKSPISYHNILSNEAVSNFSLRMEGEQKLLPILKREQKSFISKILQKCFYWETLQDYCQDHFEYVASSKISFQDTAQQLILDWRKIVREQKLIAAKFDIELSKLLEDGEDAYEKILERVRKAFTYFDKELKNKLFVPIEEHAKEIKSKKGAKKYYKSLLGLLDQLKIKHQQLEQAQFLAEGLVNGTDAKELLEKASIKKKKVLEKVKEERPKGKKLVKGETQRISLALYREGKTTEEIAKERNLVKSTIEGHLGSFVETGEITLEELVSPEKILKIMPLVEQGNFEGTSEIKQQLDESISYGDIRAVIGHLKLMESKKTT